MQALENPTDVIWAPQPGPQTWLLACPCEDVLYGGARGGGKTDALLGDWAAHASRSSGKANGILIRRTMPQLEEIIQRAHVIYGALGAEWMAGTKTWTMPDGARLKLCWLDRDEDADQYQGHSYDWVAFDEAGNFPESGPIDKMRATLRSAYGVPCVLRLTANPGGAGHEWLKERYIDPAPPLTPFYAESGHAWRVFIPSKVRDNPALLDNDPHYLDRLKASGPPWLVRAWLDGDWNAQAGGEFFKREDLLVDGHGVTAHRVDVLYAVIDTAFKSGADHDATGVVYFAGDTIGGKQLIVVDWDVVQIDSDVLTEWLPSVYARLNSLSAEWKPRMGSIGAYIEDKASGTTLLQHARKRGLRVAALDNAMTSAGKEGRAFNASPYVSMGQTKLSQYAYDKTAVYSGQTANHLLRQVLGARPGVKNPHQMDLLDCFTYGVTLFLGDRTAH